MAQKFNSVLSLLVTIFLLLAVTTTSSSATNSTTTNTTLVIVQPDIDTVKTTKEPSATTAKKLPITPTKTTKEPPATPGAKTPKKPPATPKLTNAPAATSSSKTTKKPLTTTAAKTTKKFTRKARLTTTYAKTTNGPLVQLDNITTLAPPYVAAATLKNCHLLPQDESVPLQIKNALNGGAKMIKLHLTVQQHDRKFHGTDDSKLYKPFFWVRSTGRHGTGLLLLRPEYDILSLTTLELGVVTKEVALKEEPSNCLSQLSYSDMEVLIRELVMNDFQNTTSGHMIVKLDPSDSVCNMHIANNTGIADFRYYCCNRDENLVISCEYLKSDTWLEILFAVIALLKIAIILFSPRFVPGGLYRVSQNAVPYLYKFAPGKTLTLKTILTRKPQNYPNVKNRFKLSKFIHMEKFKTTLQSMAPDVPYNISTNQAQIRVKLGRLLPEDWAPVGLFETFYESFVKCQIRERASVNECCNSDFFKLIKFRDGFVSWYRILKESMKGVVVLLLATPWLIRIYIYYTFEHDEMIRRKVAANDKSLVFHFPGNFTLYLTPLHVLFIFIYIILSLESCIFGVLRKKTKERFKLVLRKCFRDMREINRINVFGWLIRVAVKPCTVCGCVGIVLGLVSWVVVLPFLFIIMSFYIFPTVNLTVRLLAHFVLFIFPKNVCTRYRFLSKILNAVGNCERLLEMDRITKEETLEKNDYIMHSNLQRCLQLIVILMCLISMYSVIFLITEFVSFIVEIFVYTLMGIILNASTTMTYISLAFLLGVYGHDCFGYVSRKFLSFNKTMNGVILGLGQKQVEKEVYKTTGKNVAFGVQPEGLDMVDQPVQITSNIDGLPRWQMSRLVLFLSSKDQPMLPRGFYFESCHMPYYAAPGELLLSYLNAFAEFSAILVFLLFVLVVVMAFGDIYMLSPTNTMLATIAGGFLPFMLRNFVFKSHSVPSVDTSSLPFKICLYDLLKNFEQTWPIYDIDVVKCDKTFARLPSIYEEKNEIDEVFDNDKHVASSENIALMKPNVSKAMAVDNQAIDMLIVVPRYIDPEDFPGMFNGEISYREFNGSTSFLDDGDWPEDK